MKRRWIVELPGHIYDLSFIDNGILIVNEDRLLVSDLEGNVSTLYSHGAPIYKARKNGNRLVIATEDKQLLIIDDQGMKSIEVEYGLFAVATKGSNIVAGGCCGALYLFHNERMVKATSVGGHVYDIAWSDGIYVASFDGSLYKFDDSLNLVKRVELAENVNVVRTCGDKVAVGTFEPGGVFVLNHDLEKLWSRGGYLDVRLLVWRNDCRGLYVGSWDGELSLYTEDGKEILRGKGPRGIESGDWAKGMLAVGGWGRVELYEEEDVDNLLA